MGTFLIKYECVVFGSDRLYYKKLRLKNHRVRFSDWR
nr:MAG TPA: hypothetical protein [Caudoviricetes sp.]